MNIDITRLKSGIDEYALIDIIYSFTEEQLKNTDILKLDNVSIKGEINRELDDFYLDVKIEGTMVLPCSISLKPTDYPFSIKVEQTLESLKNNQNSIDIFSIIWENIVMEVPIKVINEDLSGVKTEGNGWRLIRNEDPK